MNSRISEVANLLGSSKFSIDPFRERNPRIINASRANYYLARRLLDLNDNFKPDIPELMNLRNAYRQRFSTLTARLTAIIWNKSGLTELLRNLMLDPYTTQRIYLESLENLRARIIKSLGIGYFDFGLKLLKEEVLHTPYLFIGMIENFDFDDYVEEILDQVYKVIDHRNPIELVVDNTLGVILRGSTRNLRDIFNDGYEKLSSLSPEVVESQMNQCNLQEDGYITQQLNSLGSYLNLIVTAPGTVVES